MGSTVKVLVGEIDGQEILVPTEKLLEAKDCKFSADGYVAVDAEEAIKESRNTAISLPRFPISIIMNGTVSNGDWLAYSNLTPDATIVIPTKCELREVTWSNSNDNRSFDFVFYKNGRNTTPYSTRQVRNSSNNYGLFDSLSDPFDSGDTLDIKYVDQGLNISDAAILLFFQTVI